MTEETVRVLERIAAALERIEAHLEDMRGIMTVVDIHGDEHDAIAVRVVTG